MTRFSTRALSASFCILSALWLSTAMAAPNWASVPAKDVALFYPGQSSWEWVLTNTDHPGADQFRAGKECAACHVGDEKNMGALLVSGKKNEATPIAGKPGSLDAKIQFAHDAQNMYVRIVFADTDTTNAKMDANFGTKVTVMFADAGTPETARAGCWAMCHDDAATMPSAGASTRTMYLPKTRAALTRQGGGDALKSADDLSKLKASGYGVDYWQADLNPGAPAVAVNQMVFDKRAEVKPATIAAEATFSGGTWTVTFSRKLNGGAGEISLAPGKRYTVSFAIHSGHAAKRFHYVSFERSLVLDQGTADFVAASK